MTKARSHPGVRPRGLIRSTGAQNAGAILLLIARFRSNGIFRREPLRVRRSRTSPGSDRRTHESATTFKHGAFESGQEGRSSFGPRYLCSEAESLLRCAVLALRAQAPADHDRKKLSLSHRPGKQNAAKCDPLYQGRALVYGPTVSFAASRSLCAVRCHRTPRAPAEIPVDHCLHARS
jgi:hypothetical protein